MIPVKENNIDRDSDIPVYLRFSALTLLIIILYGSSLWYGYVKEDFILVTNDLHQVFQRSFNGIHIRPIWYFSYYLTNYFGHSTLVDHAFNLLLFMCASCLAYSFCKLYIPSSRKALFLTSLWIILPWSTYPAVWISQRNDLLMEVFGLYSLLLLYENKMLRSLGMMVLAVFSKVTIMFVLLFVVFKTWKRKQHNWSIAFGVLFLVYFAMALRGVTNHSVSGSGGMHDASLQLGHFAKAAGFVLHWMEAMFLLVVPVPFFASYSHFFIYLLGIAGILYCLSFKGRNGSRDPIYLFILASIPLFMTPQLRVACLASLFALISIAQRASIVKPKFIFYTSLTFVILSFIVAGQLIKQRMDSPCHTTEMLSECVDKRFTVNDYYSLKRNWLVSAYKKLKGLDSSEQVQ